MDPERLTIVAVFRARAGSEDALREALSALPGPTRDEIGCLNYDLHDSPEERGLFFFHETWETAEHHRAHLATSHIRHLLTVTPDLLAEPIREYRGRRIL
jgi:quinol monooxygenase YgiN